MREELQELQAVKWIQTRKELWRERALDEAKMFPAQPSATPEDSDEGEDILGLCLRHLITSIYQSRFGK